MTAATAKKFRKAILKTGKYHSPDGVVDVTSDRLRHFAGEFSRMKAAGQVVPIDWDHPTAVDDMPLSLEDFERHSAVKGIGRLEDFRLADDGQSATIFLDVRTPRAVEAAENNTCFVSPVITAEWQDGSENRYSDCITYVDFVHHPVDHSQGDFLPVQSESGAVACALRMGLSSQIYQLKGAIRMADFPPKKDDEEKPDAKPEGEPDADDGTVDNETDGTPQGADNSTLADVVETLKSFKIILPEGTTGQNLLERLHSALLTAEAHQGLNQKAEEVIDPMAADPNKPKPKPELIQDPGIATMSLQTKLLMAHAERQHRATIGGRLETLCQTGRCTPAELKAQRAKLPAIRLSLTAQGEPVTSDVETFISHRESVPRGTFWTDEHRTRMSSVIEPPTNMSLEPGQEDLNNVTEWALGRKSKPA
jgi:hypothetical protein